MGRRRRRKRRRRNHDDPPRRRNGIRSPPMPMPMPIPPGEGGGGNPPPGPSTGGRRSRRRPPPRPDPDPDPPQPWAATAAPEAAATAAAAAEAEAEAACAAGRPSALGRLRGGSQATSCGMRDARCGMDRGDGIRHATGDGDGGRIPLPVHQYYIYIYIYSPFEGVAAAGRACARSRGRPPKRRTKRRAPLFPSSVHRHACTPPCTACTNTDAAQHAPCIHFCCSY